MKFYAAIDTNVIVSTMLKRKYVPWIIVSKLFDGTISPLANNEIIEEYEEVLSRKKFSFNKKNVSNFINEFRKKAILLDRAISDEQFVGLIADYLDTKCTEIDNLIAPKEQFLKEIETYKKSLIYEYVTDKKEVSAC